MAHRSRVLGLAATIALSGLAGCAQFQWSDRGPGAPGQRDAPPELVQTDSVSPLNDPQKPVPFPTADRERIATIQPWVDQVAKRHQMDPDLINGVIWVESRFVPRAKSPAGARGLMQLMPATANAMAREMGRPMARVYDPEFNVEAGSLYLLKLLDRYDGDETLALASYNAGAGNVRRWMADDGELPPRSIRYVESVQRARSRFVAMRDGRTMPEPDEHRTMLAAAPAPAPQSEPATRSQPEVPSPPGRRAAPPAASDPAPQPVNPLAPDPDVYRPAPTPEPPLAHTPYSFENKASGGSNEEANVTISKPQTLPSVLD